MGISVPQSILSRVGGKARLAYSIISHLPAHAAWTESFAGSAIITLRKSPCRREVINDLDGNIHNLFCVIRDQPEALADALALTLYGRQEFDEAYDSVRAGPDSDMDPVERARRFVVVNRQGYHGSPPPTWSISRRTTMRLASWAGLPDVVLSMADRLKHAFIECLDYEECLRKHDGPEYCHFVDPPYVGVEDKYYEVNRRDGFEHQRLRNVIEDLKGSVVVTYYEGEEILKLYRGWKQVHIPTTNAINTDKRQTELLLIRESAYAAGRSPVIDLFEDDPGLPT